MERATKTHAERRLSLDAGTIGAYRRLAQQLGFTQLRLHDHRHFAATTMLVNGIDVRTAAGRLGHARASTTLDIYAHFTPVADQRAAVALADALDAGARKPLELDGV